MFEVMAHLVRDHVYQHCDQPENGEFGHIHRAVDPCGDELSLALSWSPGRAKSLLVTAVELVDDLPDTLTTLKQGHIDADKARLIAERTRCLTVADQRHQVEKDGLAAAPQKTKAQLDQLLRRAVIAADPAGAEQRRADAAENRRVSAPQPASPDAEDGMAYMGIYGPAEDLTAFNTAINAAARHARTAGDPRTLEQLRFDALAGLSWTALNLGHLGCCNPTCTRATSQVVSSGHSPGADHTQRTGHGQIVPPVETPTCDGWPRTLGRQHGKAATVNVTVAASTLFGSDEQPGWLDGFGPITAQAARRIATEGAWRRLLTDPATGELLEYGRQTYAPPAPLIAHVVSRDRTCRFPTCTHPARDSDIDHRHPYANGGSTSATNCWTLHRQHHISKTIHQYRAHTDARGTTWWTTPAGHHYATQPEPIGPIITSRKPEAPSHPTNPAKVVQPNQQINHDPPPF